MKMEIKFEAKNGFNKTLIVEATKDIENDYSQLEFIDYVLNDFINLSDIGECEYEDDNEQLDVYEKKSCCECEELSGIDISDMIKDVMGYLEYTKGMKK